MSSEPNSSPRLAVEASSGGDGGPGARGEGEARDVAIRVEGVSKRYEIYHTPRDRLKQFIAPRLQRLMGKTSRQYFREFWALKDVSFEIKKGETVGIIGSNGSGKSTLLQIICGTLSPTCGSVETNGRVAALLELGSGFNPEFTGRENVYMNAAVLGLSRQEVDERFDDIAAFADIGEFIEQPVKTYSSGMYVRLAFSVIAHVDADILVVDEALSVGDAVFTQRCMRFIRAFQQRGTLLFVSHDMASVQNLCKSAVWLGHGQVRHKGASKDVTAAYFQYTLQEVYGADVTLRGNTAEAQSTTSAGADDESASGLVVDYSSQLSVQDNLTNATGWKSGAAEILSVSLETVGSGPVGVLDGGEIVCMAIRAKAHQSLGNPVLGFLVRDRLGQDLFGENTLAFTAMAPCPVEPGQEFRGEFVFTLPMLPNGQYVVMASVADGSLHSNVQHHWLHDALVINVSSSKVRWGLVGVPFRKVSMKVENA